MLVSAHSNKLVSRCNPEYSVCSTGSNVELLLGVEAKGMEASVSQCFNQLISICGSSAMRLLDCGVDIENAVVPAIAFCGDAIQFGAVYLIDNSFPVLVMLSDVLSPVGSYDQQIELYIWLLRLFKFSEDTFDILNASRCAPAPHGVCLSLKYFFKPVRDVKEGCKLLYCGSKAERSRQSLQLNEMMRIYQQLHQIRGAESCVLFPVGIVSVPQEGISESADLRNELEKN